MRETELILSGVTDEKGIFKTTEMKEMNAFFKAWKNSRFVLKIEVLPEEKSKKLDGYYRGYILYQFQKGFLNSGEKMLIEDINLEVGNSLGYEGDRWFENLHNIEKLKAIEQMKINAASNFGVFIEDPRII